MQMLINERRICACIGMRVCVCVTLMGENMQPGFSSVVVGVVFAAAACLIRLENGMRARAIAGIFIIEPARASQPCGMATNKYRR